MLHGILGRQSFFNKRNILTDNILHFVPYQLYIGFGNFTPKTRKFAEITVGNASSNVKRNVGKNLFYSRIHHEHRAADIHSVTVGMRNLEKRDELWVHQPDRALAHLVVYN